MAMTLEQIALEALGLPVKHRAILAEKLLLSLEEDADSDVEEKWMKEVERRWQEIQYGTAVCIPAEEVLQRLRAGLTKVERQGH